jgi:hypothetical protein
VSFYVYALLDPRKPGTYSYPELNLILEHAPFYIGKGTGRRMNAHTMPSSLKTSHNVIKNRKIEKIKSSGLCVITHKIIDFELEEDAYYYEKQAVATIGRLLDKAGPLTNIVDGGGGGNGVPAGVNHYLYGTTLSLETRLKMSESSKNKIVSEEHCKNISISKKGIPQSDKAREINRISHTGHIHTEDHKNNIRAKMQGREILWKDKIAKAQQGEKGVNYIVQISGREYPS